MMSKPITVPAFGGNGIRHFFGTRLPPSRADEEYPDARAVVSVKQVHGTEALIVDRLPKEGAEYPGGWDALITDQPGVMVTVKTADCVPVLFHDAHRGIVAAVHAGWRGTMAGIIPKTLAQMRRYFHAEAKNIRMVIGPSAGLCCYEVDEQVLRPLRSRYPYWQLVVRETGRQRALLDLRKLIHRQAQGAGVEVTRIWTVSVCTICHPQLFYSYRRDGVVKQTMVSGIMLAGEARRAHPRRSDHRSRPARTI